MKITLVTPSLDIGGSERQLIILARELTRRGHLVTVVCFYSGGRFLPNLALHGINVVELKKEVGKDFILSLFRLTRCLKTINPEVIYAFREVANVGVALAPIYVPVVWGIRGTDVAFFGWRAAIANLAQRLLSWRAKAIIANSSAAAKWARTSRFPSTRIHCIPNGIDVDLFRPTSSSHTLRHKWGLRPDDIVLGISARLDPLKDHSTLFRAFANVCEQVPRLVLVCIGDGPTTYKRHLDKVVSDLSIRSRVKFVGSMTDMTAAYNTLDFACCSSASESFPNAVAEAMACGLPVITTDVGDCAYIVGDTGRVVRPQDPQSLGNAIVEFCALDLPSRAALGKAARKRIVQYFTIRSLGDRTEAILMSIVAR